MVFSLFRRKKPRPELVLYGGIVAQARQPGFYKALGVADTVDGRFDMMVLHTFLVLRRLQGEGETAKNFAQQVFDTFFDDMDSSLREMGATDTGVPRKIKSMVEAFFGRSSSYMEALNTGERARLAEALARNIFPETEELGSDVMATCLRLADYVTTCAETLGRQDVGDLMCGTVIWPAPPKGEGSSHGPAMQ